MSLVTTVRRAIAAELSDELGVEFVDGKLDGPVERRDLGCSWSEGAIEDEQNVLYEWAEIHVRVFKNFTENRDPERPLDPAVLEDLGEQIQLSLKDKQATQFGCDFLRVVGYGIDVDRQGVEATIRVSLPNPFAPV